MTEQQEEKPFHISIPELCLVALVGASGCGKSTWTARHFLPTEVLSSDRCRAWVSDDETDQSATSDAFEVLHFLARKRLERGKLVVVDATNVQAPARRQLIELARSQNVLAVAIAFNVPERVCQDRNRTRTDRQVPAHAIARQSQNLRQSLKSLKDEGFRYVHVLGIEEMARATVERTRLWNDRRDDHGPFDIIGDVHGCADELEELLAKLGYAPNAEGVWAHPEGRRAFFVGDLVDRGPRALDSLALARRMTEAGTALAVPGNHDDKFLRWLRGRRVQMTHGLAESADEVDALPAEARQAFVEAAVPFLDGLVSHYVLDDGRLVVAHAGLTEELQGRASGRVREFCLYGDVTGETDEAGLPVRRDWAARYRGRATVVYGHTPQPRAEWVNNTINIDTGCVFGGSLTALRWPEREMVSVPARRQYAEPARPLILPAPDSGEVGAQDAAPLQTVGASDLLLSDVTGKRTVATRLAGNVFLQPENSAAALEVISRFAVDPRWLVYLPPTMSPCETEREGPYLEHPDGAFGYYRGQGVETVICEEKHMGSRAVIVICRDAATARERFRVAEGRLGECYTRTGRRFFEGPAHEEFLKRVGRALDAAGFWEAHQTNWAMLDAEILPWNAKAQGLLREQYAPVGAAATASLDAAHAALALAAARGVAISEEAIFRRQEAVAGYVAAYRAYCWPVSGLEGVAVAPFHLLATEGAVHADKDHLWHLSALAPLADADPALFRRTEHHVVHLHDDASVAAGVEWWLTKTAAQAEGMVVKPLAFLAEGRKGLAQPAVKCRGREYLRIIYGPEYTLPQNLERLRARGLGGKRALALREFALGIEGLERFVRGEPLHRVHECAFAVLALESEPVDPRL
ncbi:MAG: polynucleotide kinase-phosphatase [Armatimonadetes bacterium]|nr:polynucleotide kinase-phosphatase [Armatimonadota bacterium]